MASQPVLRMQQTGANPAFVVADKWLRVAGYLIDVVPAIVLSLVGLIPIVGIIFAGLLLAPYWLLRDIAGASLGKMLLGMRIVGQDGQPATTGARVLRNLPLIAAPLCMIIPLLGYFVTIPVALIVVLVEGTLLLSQGSRLGDKMAGTVVVRK
ncbi:MAG TPA: RDD family protein [Candidatus Angelobacter sp.]